MGTPARIVAEPTGLEDVRIGHETLNIDLRPLRVGDPAIVDATYQLQNDGVERTVELWFAFGSSRVSDYRVTLDDRAVEGELVPNDPRLPESWWPPRTTPPLNDDAPPAYGVWRAVARPLAFRVTLPPGESRLHVHYRELAKLTYARPTMPRQFAYILAPARDWGGFGGLDVTVRVPEAWRVASEPRLSREGAALSGEFEGVPADALRLTLRPPAPSGYFWVRRGAQFFYIALGLAGVGFCWWWGARRVRLRMSRGAGRSVGRDVLASVSVALLFGMAVFAAGMFWVAGVDALFPPSVEERAIIERLNLSDGYGGLVAAAGVLLSGLAAFVVGGLAVWLSGVVVSRRQRLAIRSPHSPSPTSATRPAAPVEHP